MRIRRFGLAFASAALAVATIAGTASAAGHTATVSVVHGIPGARVNVCVDGSLVKSSFRYGGKFTLTGVAAGDHRVKLVPWYRGCGAKAIIAKTVTVTGGLNATIVARTTSTGAGLQVFVNDLTISAAGKTSITVRHTAAAPTVDVWLNGGAAPAISSLARGGSVGPVELSPGVYSWWVSGVGGYAPVIGPRVASLAADKAYQIYAIGTNATNYRFVIVVQPAVAVV
jgi:Domain of unknown function (DUF4397)